MERMTRDEKNKVEETLEPYALDDAQRAVALAAAEILSRHALFDAYSSAHRIGAAAERLDAGSRANLREKIHAVVLERAPDLRSPLI